MTVLKISENILVSKDLKHFFVQVPQVTVARLPQTLCRTVVHLRVLELCMTAAVVIQTERRPSSVRSVC